MDQHQLIKECKQGSHAAQKCLFDHFASHMMMVCKRYLKNQEDAEEIMLDGFFRFFKNITSFQYQSDGALFNWLRKIMINECLMFLRKKNVFVITAETENIDIGYNDYNLDKLSADEIFMLVTQLPIGYRTVFNLYVVEGIPHKEIAELLNITEGTSKSQLAKARQLLQKLLIQKNEDYARRKIN